MLAFALADGIERQHHESLQSQIRGESLPFRLPLLGMAGLQENSGITTRLIGTVEIGRDIVARQTFENHLFDRIVLSLDAARNPGIQRAAVVGQTADQRQKGLADRLLPALRVGDAVDLGNGVFPLL